MWKCNKCNKTVPGKPMPPIRCNCGIVDNNPIYELDIIENKKRYNSLEFYNGLENNKFTSKRSEISINDFKNICVQCPNFTGTRCEYATGGCEESKINLWQYWLRKGNCPIGKWTPNKSLGVVNNLAVVSCYYNPCHYQRPKENYFRYKEGIEKDNVPLYTIELAFDDDEFEIDSTFKIRGTREKHLLWQKERLLNYAIKQIPLEYDAIAWIDMDVLFDNEHWVDQTKHALQFNHVIQPWETMLFLDLEENSTYERKSCGWYYANKKDEYKNLGIAHPGFAWAARAEWIRKYGLYDYMVTGGGDSMMLPGFTDCYLYIIESLNSNWIHHTRQWSKAVYKEVQGKFSFIPGTIRHLFHGDRRKRMYVKRWKLLKDAGFNPATDIYIDDNCLLTWTDFAIQEKSDMVKWIKLYFNLRDEDG